MSCRQLSSGRLDCDYRVGDGLRFLIAGVGQIDVVVNFYKVQDGGEWTAGVAPLHGCVIVRPAQAKSDSTLQVAYVSPVDGKVYRNWNTCLKTPKR